MASLTPLLPFFFPFLATSFVTVFAFQVSIKPTHLSPLSCPAKILTCNASLYHISHNLTIQQIASFYSVTSSHITPIKHGTKQDYLITVPCSCKHSSDLSGYFYDTTYKVRPHDTFVNISNLVFSGQAWPVNGTLNPDENLAIHLPCGCSESDSQIVVTYTVQPDDTPTMIVNLLNASLADIMSMNKVLAPNFKFIDAGWVLFVPKGSKGLLHSTAAVNEKKLKWTTTIIGILAGVTFLSVTTTIILIVRVNKVNQMISEDSHLISRRSIANRTISSKYNFQKECLEDVISLESERPIVYNLEKIEEATNNFDESRRIGSGGYGSVYFGVLGNKEVAVKKMRSNKSKEFYAELKVLCKIHHINIVGDFGLAKLVDRTDDENFIATRLVGTPGYLPPESLKELQVTPKTDVFAFGVVLSELLTGKRALFRESQDEIKMKSLISVVNKIFQDDEPEIALEDAIDKNLEASYRMEDVYKMAEIAEWCLQEDPIERPEMRDIIGALSQIVISSIEWEASLCGNSQVFSGLYSGR
ncbi:hypothetical protein LR48_Vigan01g124400 [Vigna angularis]|uniref:Protein kinase domain-containing protein n=1 Tax=Phaseolus angularis TaxID=3914 RepID=A0A0L9TND7_PHAAN|nr:hypothetical protein LR48_Vigan01g124400 [Vigna angularis]